MREKEDPNSIFINLSYAKIYEFARLQKVENAFALMPDRFISRKAANAILANQVELRIILMKQKQLCTIMHRHFRR